MSAMILDRWRRVRHAIAWWITPRPLRNLLVTAAELSRARGKIGWPYGPLGMPQERAYEIAKIFGLSDEGWRAIQEEFFFPVSSVTRETIYAAAIARFIGLALDFYLPHEEMLPFPKLGNEEVISSLTIAARYHEWRRAQSLPSETKFEDFYPYPVGVDSDVLRARSLKQYASVESRKAAVKAKKRVIDDYKDDK